MKLTEEQIRHEMLLLKDERAKNGWTRKEGNRYLKLVQKLKKLTT